MSSNEDVQKINLEEYKKNLIKEFTENFHREKEILTAIVSGKFETPISSNEEELMEYLEYNVLNHLEHYSDDSNDKYGNKSGKLYAKSGLELNDEYKYDNFEFYDDRAYAVFNVSSNCDYIVDSHDCAYIAYKSSYVAKAEAIVVDWKTNFENNILSDFASNVLEGFSEGKFFESEQHKYLVAKKEVNAESMKEYINDNISQKITNGRVVEFSDLLAYLDENKFDLHKSVVSMIENGAFNSENFDGEPNTVYGFIKDIEEYQEMLKDLTNEDQFEYAKTVFGVDAEKLTTVDLRDIEVELELQGVLKYESDDEPEPEVKKKNKPKM